MPARCAQNGFIRVAIIVASVCGCDDDSTPRTTPPPANDAGQDDGGHDGGDGADGSEDLDAGLADDGSDGEMDAGSPGDGDGSQGACGDEIAPTAQLEGTEGLAIAGSGTLYYSQYGAVGRRRPGAAPENDWLKLGDGAGTVWGLALGEDDTLYVASPDEGRIYRVDTRAAAPTAEVFSEEAANVNGLIVGPDGAVYTSDFAGDGHVFRFAVPGAARTTVTRTPIATPNGLLFSADDTLLVLSYADAAIVPLTLDGDHRESARGAPTLLSDSGAALDGIARDERGRIYVTDNANGVLIRFTAELTEPEPLLRDLPAAANMAFGKGALDCLDLYIASGGALGRYHADATGAP